MRRGCAALFVAVALIAIDGPSTSATDDMVLVPAGRFTMGSARGDDDERPVRRVRLPAFEIDRYEVRQAQYDRCVREGPCSAPQRYLKSRGASMPAVGISWEDARSYCAWRGKRLPTEAEWERAARGTDGRSFPWGEGLRCDRANFGNFAGSGACAEKNPGRVLPVGSRPLGVSPTGSHDMAGNVWEWVAGRYDKRGDLRLLRGGSCCSYFSLPTATNRHRLPASYFDFDIGFRCARSVKERQKRR